MKKNKSSLQKNLPFILLILLIALGVGYYMGYYSPLNQSIRSASSEQENLRSEIEEVQLEIDSLEEMQAEVERLSDEGVSRVYSYNNMKAELAELNEILGNAKSYTINFSELTQEDMLIRRQFELAFHADSYAAAKELLTQLSSSQYRCLLGDIDFSTTENGADISLTATYFETMYDGTPDSGLPAPDED